MYPQPLTSTMPHNFQNDEDTTDTLVSYLPTSHNHTLFSDHRGARLQSVSNSRRSQKLIRYFSRKDTADEIVTKGGAEAKVREEVGVAGSDEGQVGELFDQSVEVVINFTVAEGGVVGGDQVGGGFRQGQQGEEEG